MKLKEKILIKAVELFNEQGITSTSPNNIAAALDISSGNLTYHYKTKAILVAALYERMHADSQDFIKLEGYLTLDDFRKIMVRFRDFMVEYRLIKSITSPKSPWNHEKILEISIRSAAILFLKGSLKKARAASSNCLSKRSAL